MTIYLVQHGKSYSKEADPEQPLTQQGIAEINRIAAAAKGHGVQPNIIYHSGKKRAEQTAELFAGALCPPDGVAQLHNINPLDDVQQFPVQECSENNAMVVGHLPYLEKLTSYLITQQTGFQVLRFQNAGIVCLEHDETSDGFRIRWTLMPGIR